MRQNADKAICITTAKFTHDGKIAAEDDGIELIDGEELLIKLNEYYPGKYYNSVFLTY
jgi:restriction endonuclease Mrr